MMPTTVNNITVLPSLSRRRRVAPGFMGVVGRPAVVLRESVVRKVRRFVAVSVGHLRGPPLALVAALCHRHRPHIRLLLAIVETSLS